MSLRRAAVLGAVQSGVSMAVSFLSVKVTSVFLGPAGIGLLGQLQNFTTMAQGVLASGMATSVVRRTAQSGPDAQSRARILSTTLRLVLVSGLPVALVIALASGWLARELLHDAELQAPLLVFALVYVVGMMGMVVLAAANGVRDYRAMTLAQIGGGLASLALFALLCPTLGVLGGLLAGAVFPATNAAAAWLSARGRAWWPARPMSHGYAPAEARLAMAFVPMAAIKSVSMPLVQIVIRDSLARQSGMAAVGLLHGVMRLSDMYITIATTVFGMYFLPRFSELRHAEEAKRELKKGFATVLPVVGLISLAMYLMRDLITRVVFTAEFHAMRDLFAWQMVGNVLKVIGWFFAHLMVAKLNPLALAAFELVMGVFWWQAGIYLVKVNGAVGATQAYALHYAVYALAALFAVLLALRRMERAPAPGAAR